jgi:uncharacterized protein with PIN domain
MVIDTSALLAILLGDPEADPFARAIAAGPKRLISTFRNKPTDICAVAKRLNGEGFLDSFG